MLSLTVSEWYGAAFGSMFAMWLSVRLLIAVSNWLVGRLAPWCRQNLIYPRLWSAWILLGGMSPYEVLLLMIYIGSNGFCMAYRVNSMSEASSRAAILSTINMVPLLVGSRLSIAADILGLTIRGIAILHRWMGLLSTVQAVVHASLSVANKTSFRWNSSNLFGFISLGCVLVTLAVCMQCLRRRQYEIFLRSHFTFAGLGSITLWKHLAVQSKGTRFVILAGLCMWCLLLAIRYVYGAYRNLTLLMTHARTEVTHLDEDTLRLAIHVARAWKIEPWHYIYVNFPYLSLTSTLQSHPFMITWWEYKDGEFMVYCLVQIRNGFTRRLAAHDSQRLTTFITGPHGSSTHFEDYGTVMMFASGSGIAAQLPHVKDLFSRFAKAQARTRRIHIVWEVARVGHVEWIQPWMDELLAMDTEFRLNLSIHIRNNEDEIDFKRSPELYAGTHLKVAMRSEEVNVEDYLSKEIEGEILGTMLVAVSAREPLCQGIREYLRHHVTPDIRLVDLGHHSNKL